MTPHPAYLTPDINTNSDRARSRWHWRTGAGRGGLIALSVPLIPAGDWRPLHCGSGTPGPAKGEVGAGRGGADGVKVDGVAGRAGRAGAGLFIPQGWLGQSNKPGSAGLVLDSSGQQQQAAALFAQPSGPARPDTGVPGVPSGLGVLPRFAAASRLFRTPHSLPAPPCFSTLLKERPPQQ